MCACNSLLNELRSRLIKWGVKNYAYFELGKAANNNNSNAEQTAPFACFELQRLWTLAAVLITKKPDTNVKERKTCVSRIKNLFLGKHHISTNSLPNL